MDDFSLLSYKLKHTFLIFFFIPAVSLSCSSVFCSYFQQSSGAHCSKIQHFDQNNSWRCRHHPFKDHQVSTSITTRQQGWQSNLNSKSGSYVVVKLVLYNAPAIVPPGLYYAPVLCLSFAHPPSSSWDLNLLIPPLTNWMSGRLCLSWCPEREQWRTMSIVVFGAVIESDFASRVWVMLAEITWDRGP